MTDFLNRQSQNAIYLTEMKTYLNLYRESERNLYTSWLRNPQTQATIYLGKLPKTSEKQRKGTGAKPSHEYF